MAVPVNQPLLRAIEVLRYDEMARRVRAMLDGEVAIDSARARLVWEPGRLVPYYAVPEEDVLVGLVPVPEGTATPEGEYVDIDGGVRVVKHSPFGFHTAEGQALSLASGGRQVHAALRPDDEDLAGYVVLNFHAFDGWFEEDERIHGHPHDPYKRIDVLASSRQVRIEVQGVVVADSARPRLLFETFLPVRSYLPRDDVRMNLLRPSDTRTICAYKGEASYWSLEHEGVSVPDIAWTYVHPLNDAAPVRDLVCFLDERVDVTVDGQRVERPRSPFG